MRSNVRVITIINRVFITTPCCLRFRVFFSPVYIVCTHCLQILRRTDVLSAVAKRTRSYRNRKRPVDNDNSAKNVSIVVFCHDFSRQRLIMSERSRVVTFLLSRRFVPVAVAHSPNPKQRRRTSRYYGLSRPGVFTRKPVPNVFFHGTILSFYASHGRRCMGSTL